MYLVKIKSFIIFLLLFSLVFSSFFVVPIVSADWWDTDWDYFKTVTVTDRIDDYVTFINVSKSSGGDVDCNNHCNDNFSDIRFVYNNATLLPYWIEDYSSGDYVHIWVNNSGNYSSFDMFYGNTGVGNVSSGSDTFLFFEDFDSISEWSHNTDTHFSLSGGVMTCTESSTWGYIYYDLGSAMPVKLKLRGRETHVSPGNTGLIHTGFFDRVLSSWEGSTDDDMIIYFYDNSKYFRCEQKDDGVNCYQLSTTFTVNTWYKSMVCFDDDGYLYNDNNNIIDSSVDSGCTASDEPRYLFVQTRNYNTNFVVQYDWMFASFHIAGTEPSFSFGSEVQGSINHVPINSNPFPSDSAIDVSISISTLNITISDVDADIMNITFRTNESGSWNDADSNSSVYNGTYYCLNTSWVDSYDTTYWWSSNTSDGNGGWDNDTYSFTTEVNPWQSVSFGGSVEVTFTPSISCTINCSSGDNWDEVHFIDWTLGATGVGYTYEYNVSEDNQTDLSRAALNITNTGNVALNFSIMWESDPNPAFGYVAMKYNTSDSAPDLGDNNVSISPSSTQFITNLGPTDYEEIWLWMDFVGVTSGGDGVNVTITYEQYVG